MQKGWDDFFEEGGYLAQRESLKVINAGRNPHSVKPSLQVEPLAGHLAQGALREG
jgi:hypothetical protein